MRAPRPQESGDGAVNGKSGRLKPWHIALAIFAVICAVVLSIAGGWLSPIIKRKLISTLRETYQSDVELSNLYVSLWPYPRASGDGLVLRLHGRTDIPPLIKLRHFEAGAGWHNALRGHVGTVRLQGLEVRISRGDSGDNGGSEEHAEHKKPVRAGFLIDTIVADNALVEILPKNPLKDPLDFSIFKLTMTDVALDRPAQYQAELRNAKPPGLIQVAGDFGPWNGGEPGDTPLTGKFQFSHADLGVFKGLAGTLSSTGEFRGVLSKLEVSGKTDSPDFTVKAGNHPMHLRTTYQATVDGTNGDTLLHPVIADFGRTRVTANGSVTNLTGTKGKTVSLDAVVDHGNLADVLRFAVKSNEPPLEGNISFHSKIVIPPGDRDIAEKLQLIGKFHIEQAVFTSPSVEQKVATLSERSRGDTDSGGQTRPRSDFEGTFSLNNGIVKLAGLNFVVPGARIQLAGTYGLLTEQMDFRGLVITDVKLSQMTTGWKSVLLKAIDPIFSKNRKGAAIPIHIGGTRESPSIGLELGRAVR
jgi:hypothetical protein